MERNLFRDGYGYDGCKLFFVPPLPGPSCPQKSIQSSPVAGVIIPLAEIISIDWQRIYALKATEKRLLKKKLSGRFQSTSNKGHIFGQRGVAQRYAKSHAKRKCKSGELFM
jgi:hypothetical protein